MVWLVSVQDESLEDAPPKSRSISKRELLSALIVFAILIPLLLFGFANGQEDGNKTYCRTNLNQIGKAMLLYVAANDDRFPPTHAMDQNGAPAIEPTTGLPEYWATPIHAYMSKRNDFWCRSGKQEDGWSAMGGRSGVREIRGNYGMYRGLSTTPKIQITSTGSTILIAETCNNGSSTSFDPKPFGNGLDDGFLIGWDDSNLEFSSTSKWATRLAFSGAADGYDGAKVKGRHKDFIHAITVEGALHKMSQSDAKIGHLPPRLKGLWWCDPNYYR